MLVCSNPKCRFIVTSSTVAVECPACRARGEFRKPAWKYVFLPAESLQAQLRDRRRQPVETVGDPRFNSVQLGDRRTTRGFYTHRVSAARDKAKNGNPREAQAAVLRGLVLAYHASPDDIPAALDEPPQLPEGWEDEFPLSLCENGADVAGATERINESIEQVRRRWVVVHPVESLSETNFKQIKWRIKNEWLEHRGGLRP
jgi:hypothetical protein